MSSSLIDFFRYYSRDFSYNIGVASIRAGLLKKESKGWQNDVCCRNLTKPSVAYSSHQLSSSKFNDARERNRFCIEVSRWFLLIHAMYPLAFRIPSKLILTLRGALPEKVYTR